MGSRGAIHGVVRPRERDTDMAGKRKNVPLALAELQRLRRELARITDEIGQCLAEMERARHPE